MFRGSYLSAVLLLGAAGVASGADKHPAPAKPAAPPPPPPAQRGKQPPTIVDRWNRMSPEEQQKQLAKLPPERRKRVEEQLKQYKNMTPEERRQYRSQMEMFSQFPPARQQQVNRLSRQFSQMPKDRQTMMTGEFDKLRGMSDAQRGARINSDEFRNKYNANEQKFLGDMSGLLPPKK